MLNYTEGCMGAMEKQEMAKIGFVEDVDVDNKIVDS